MKTGIVIGENDLEIVPIINDGLIVQGVKVSDITRQNQSALLVTTKGEVKLSPWVGIGIQRMMNEHDLLSWKSEIRKQIEADGQKINILIIDSQNISIDASYSTE